MYMLTYQNLPFFLGKIIDLEASDHNLSFKYDCSYQLIPSPSVLLTCSSLDFLCIYFWFVKMAGNTLHIVIRLVEKYIYFEWAGRVLCGFCRGAPNPLEQLLADSSPHITSHWWRPTRQTDRQTPFLSREEPTPISYFASQYSLVVVTLDSLPAKASEHIIVRSGHLKTVIIFSIKGRQLCIN